MFNKLKEKYDVKISLFGGGLGDQVEAEPIIRYCLENDFKGCKITVLTNYPEIFYHLKDRINIITDYFYEIKNPFLLSYDILPELNHPIHRLIKPTWCIHPTDWASLIILNRLLPNIEKQIKLEINPDLLNVNKINFEDPIVTIHPSQNDEYRTLPNSYWVELINKIIKLKDIKTIIIIGKDGKEKGVNDFIIKNSKIIDLRNQTNISDLFYIIKNTDYLISNDSAPIHIAGAFTCKTILLNTLKSPEYILPFRNGYQTLKQVSISKKLFCDDFDISIFNVQRNRMLPEFNDNILDYAPCIDNVMEELKWLSF